nr:hypothetical protein [Candidatus Krumholzibacteria bacterium]
MERLPFFSRWLFLLVLLGTLVLWPGPVEAQGAPSTADPSSTIGTEGDLATVAKAREVLGSRYQTSLPESRVEVPEEIRSIHVLPDIFSKIAMVLGVILISVLLMQAFYQGGKLGPDGAQGLVDSHGDVDFSRLKVPDPDLLARDGQFAEAIHALLLRSLVLVSRRLGLTWPQSLTSREILHQGALSGETRAQLLKLVQRVEVHHFGGLTPQAPDFQRCREIYDRLDLTLQERGS